MNNSQNHGRIAVMENLEVLTRVETLCLRWNMISKIQNVSTLTSLTELDLYDNQVGTLWIFVRDKQSIVQTHLYADHRDGKPRGTD